MMNWFNKGKEVAIAKSTVEKVNLKGKTTNEIIEEIHESFFTEVDKLLEEAKIFKSLETNKQDLIDKCARLKALGFNSTKEVVEAEQEIQRLNDLERENEVKANLVEAINYFSFKYPNYKFITEDSVKKICEKYNLVYGDVSNYIGTVPDKNLKHIEDFKIDENDECYYYEDGYWSMMGYSILNKSFVNYGKYLIYKDLNRSSRGIRTICEKMPMEIAAPIKDFNTDKMELNGYKLDRKIEIPDPVVLKPVLFNGNKYYLVVTAWGLEASDELVVNQKMN